MDGKIFTHLSLSCHAFRDKQSWLPPERSSADEILFIPLFYIFFSLPKCLSCFETFACVCLKLGLEIQEQKKNCEEK